MAGLYKTPFLQLTILFWRRRAFLLILMIVSTVYGHVAAAGGVESDDVLLKTAYLYNFAKFARWEGAAAGESLYLCTAGDDELAESLLRLTGKPVGNRRIVIHTAGKSTACHILYIASSESTNYNSHLDALQGQQVLTVSEITGFAANGGMIEMFQDAERIRFRINVTSVAESGLVLSSRLLSLAQIVERKPR